MGITSTLADWVTRTRFEDVPDDVIHVAKRLVLDVLANAIGGSSTSAAALGVKTLRSLGGAEQSTVLVHGFRTSAPHAAFANVLMAGALEADDTPLQLGHHAHTAVLPALALAEQAPVSGSDYLLAVALGYEFGIRVALAARHVRIEPDGSVTRSTTGNGVNYVVFPAVVGAANGPRWVSAEYWNDAAVESIKARVRTHVCEQMDKAFFSELLSGPRRRSPHSVRVVTKDGRTFERTGELAPGDPQSPETYLDDKALIGKFRQFTEQVLSPAAIDAVAETVMSLDSVPDVRTFVEHIARGSS